MTQDNGNERVVSRPTAGPIRADVNRHTDIYIHVHDDSYARAYCTGDGTPFDPTVHLEFGTYHADHVHMDIPRSLLMRLLDEFDQSKARREAEKKKNRDRRAAKKK